VHQTYDYRPAAYFRHYCDDEDAPIYEFGHGLSYTEFEYHGLTVPEEIEAGQPLDVELHVKNTGTREGEHVVLCYITDHYASVTLPVKRLAAFRRIGLSPGESQKVAFSIPPERFSVYDRDMVRRVEPGTFTVSAGSLDAEFCVR
jgi:beta-glucosidase